MGGPTCRAPLLTTALILSEVLLSALAISLLGRELTLQPLGYLKFRQSSLATPFPTPLEFHLQCHCRDCSMLIHGCGSQTSVMSPFYTRFLYGSIASSMGFYTWVNGTRFCKTLSLLSEHAEEGAVWLLDLTHIYLERSPAVFWEGFLPHRGGWGRGGGSEDLVPWPRRFIYSFRRKGLEYFQSKRARFH